MEVLNPGKVSLHLRIKSLLEQLCDGLYERDEAVRLALLSAIAGESIFILGPPGVGKSLIARRLKFAFRDGTSFEYLMSKFSTPDEIFGPISIKKLKDEDKYERLTERYLPGANIVFLDEIWKAGPAIQNALLTILNEKIYRNGDSDMRVNIRGIITASNELPPRNSNIAPIWDRFLIRYELGNIKTFKNFISMITDVKDIYEDQVDVGLKCSNAELNTWSSEIDAIEIGPEVLNTIQLVKIKITEHNTRVANSGIPIIIHDRRWKKLVRLMRTSAFLNGRAKVDLMDCFLMNHCLWDAPDQKPILSDILNEVIGNHGYTLAVNITALRSEISEFENEVESEIHIAHTTSEPQLMPVLDDYFKLEKHGANKFEGSLITIKQYRALDLNGSTIVNFYDEKENLINRLKANKGKKENTIEVIHNSAKFTYSLLTRLVDSTEVVIKKPHAVVQKYWDDKCHQLNAYIDEQLQKLKQNKPAELDYIHQHLFVDAIYGAIVSQNYEKAISSLQELKLSLEKLQFTYTNV